MGDEFANIKDESWNLFYDSYLQEVLSDALIKRWSQIDMGTKFLIALAASSSAVAGWSLWSTVEGKIVWGMIAGIAAITSITNNIMSVPDRLKKQQEVRNDFLKLRLELETFRQRLKFDEDLKTNLNESRNQFFKFREKFTECCTKVPSDDIGLTNRFYKRIQDDLNNKLKTEGKIYDSNKNGKETANPR